MDVILPLLEYATSVGKCADILYLIIFGRIYSNCVDYDLCEQCEPLGIHDETHVFIKLRKPTTIASGTPLLSGLLYDQDR